MVERIPLVPLMTSNTAPSGTVSASSDNGVAFPFRVFNGNRAQPWVTANGVVSGWLRYDFPSQTKMNQYSVYSQISTTTNRAPKDWTFEGSNDGANWIILDTQVNQTDWVDNVEKVYTLKETAEYSKYRINVTSNNGDTAYLTIAEIQFYEIPTMNKILLLSKNSVYSHSYDSIEDKATLTQVPSSSEQNLITYGMESPVVNLEKICEHKNYILTQDDSQNEVGLLTTQINRKPLSIKFN